MKADEFVYKLFNAYDTGYDGFEIDAQMDNLTKMLTESGIDCDYNKLFSIIQREHNSKKLPTIPKILDYQKRARISNYDTSRNGELVVFKCYSLGVDGHYELKDIREYTVWNSDGGGKTIEQVEKQLKYDSIYDEIEVRHFPPESTCMYVKEGLKVFYPPYNGECKTELIAS